MKRSLWLPLTVLALSAITRQALACGCFAPPIPTPGEADFAVNQQAEQIIFEVQDDNKVSAHVRIFYQGDPKEFAWLLPMPSIPDLELSNGLLFGLVDQNTSPQVGVVGSNLCPQQRYYCRAHSCPNYYPSEPGYPGAYNAGAPTSASGGAAGDAESAPVQAPPVQVLAQQQIGAYDTVTFAAEDAGRAVEWLNENGFIINETMSPYMQPYLDEGMVFVASKLIPGADLDEIRPLRLTYESDTPSIPLQLTAIAAEPHMMVTAFIYSDEEFDPSFHPLVEVPTEALANAGRVNYPMVLSRIIDEQGGDAFVKEYVGQGPQFLDSTGCCSEESGDWCGVGGDSLCQCPLAEFDAEDCAESEDIVEAAKLAKSLADTYPVLTRLSTRVSPEEMVYNPEFTPAANPQGNMRLNLRGTQYSLVQCEDQVIDQDELERINEEVQCSALYCDWGECVITSRGAGCACDEGFVARTFSDVDGSTSITCVPSEGAVDFAAGGIELPDACEGKTVKDGECVDIGGFAAVHCDDGLAAVGGPVIAGVAALPSCQAVTATTNSKGADNFSAQLQDLDVCAPPPPTCRADGWLEELEVTNPGVQCGDPPDPSWFEVPRAPECPMPGAPNTPAAGGASSSSEGAGVTEEEPVDLTPKDTTAPRPGSESKGDEPSESTDEPEAKANTGADDDAGAPTAEVNSDEDTDDDGWCSVGPVGRGSAPKLPWLMALGAGLLLRRRPRRSERRTR